MSRIYLNITSKHPNRNVLLSEAGLRQYRVSEDGNLYVIRDAYAGMS